MKKQTRRDFLKLAGASAVAATGVASAAENPFSFAKMESGYTQLADNHMEGKNGEGKCGGDKAKEKLKEKAKEGKCGEGKCGGDKAKEKLKEKAKEGKCGGNS